MTLFLVDDCLNIVYKNKIIENKMDGVVNKGYIIHKVKFMEEFMKILKKEKIKGKLFGDSINIVKNTYFSNGDIYFLESLFTDLGFIRINFIDIREILPGNNAIYIEINNSYMVINLDKGIYLDLDYFKDIPSILDYFKVFLTKDVILFGVNKNISKFKMKDIVLYHLENSEKYILESLLKVKKDGA